MADIETLVRTLGGMAQKQQLVRRGATDLDLTRAVRSGEVVRARQGWYSTLPERDPRLRAVRVGGRLTGISAIAAMGGWVRTDHSLHVSVPVNGARLRSQWNRRRRLAEKDGVVVHWDDPDLGHRGSVHTVGLLDALHRTALDESLEDTIAAIDWALRTGRIDEFDVLALAAGLPRSFADLPAWVDPLCDSLPESLCRTRLRLSGHTVTSQVELPTAERVDLVVDGCIGLETDGKEFHIESFERDRRKDLAISLEKLHGIRLPASVVFTEWDLALRAIEVALSQHVRAPRIGNSGLRSGRATHPPGFTRLRRRERNRSPEFPKAARKSGAGGQGSPPGNSGASHALERG